MEYLQYELFEMMAHEGVKVLNLIITKMPSIHMDVNEDTLVYYAF